MFITRDGVTIALDTIASFRYGYNPEVYMDGQHEYYIAFELKPNIGMSKTSNYQAHDHSYEITRPNTEYFRYGADKDARDLAYKLLLERYSLEL